MSSIVIAGDTSGSVTLQAPAVAGSTVLNLPATSGTIQASGAGYTTNGVAYATSATGLVTGSTLSYNGTRLLIGGVSAGTVALSIPAGDITSDVSSGSFAVGNYGDTSSALRLSTRGFTNFITGATDGTNGTEQMRITSVGLGIKTSSPIAPLTVQGDSGGLSISIIGRSTGQNESWLYWYKNGGSVLNAGILGDNQGLKFAIGSGATEAARFDTSGNLLVGTTNIGIYSFASATGVNINAAGTIGASSSGTTLFVNRTTSDGAVVGFYRAGNQVGTISVTTSATAYNTSSDYRLKNTIAPMTGALAKVAQLKPVTYKWNADNSDGQGFIAHELAEIIPDCVTGQKDAVDADGNPQYQGIDTSFLVATVVAALQEQQALITQLTERITALEAN